MNYPLLDINEDQIENWNNKSSFIKIFFFGGEFACFRSYLIVQTKNFLNSVSESFFMYFSFSAEIHVTNNVIRRI